MRFRKHNYKILEGDLTPMIDMTFQLIAFFMLIINFSEIEKSEDIQLPLSELAKPPEQPPDYKITLNLYEDGSIQCSNQVVSGAQNLRPILVTEIRVAAGEGVSKANIYVIIRADRNVKTGLVQDLMAKCREHELETFALRVDERLR